MSKYFLSCRRKRKRMGEIGVGLRGTSLLVLMYENYFDLPKQRGTYSDVDFIYEHKKRATQVLDCGGQALARGSCLSQLLNRGAQVVSRGAVPSASQVLDRGAEAVVRSVQASAKTVSCGDATLSH
jgi:hypothetical protein